MRSTATSTAGRTSRSAPNVKITSSWRHEMPELYDVLPRQHIPMVDARAPGCRRRDPAVNFTTPVELGYDTTAAVAESTRCLMCNYNIWFDPFRCVLCGACADVCPEGVIHMVDVNQLKTEGLLPEIEEAYGWAQGAAMILDEERCIRCALCVKRCPFDAITMERFELQEISSDGRLYKESYRDAQLAGTRRRGRRSQVSFLERVDQSIRRSPVWRSIFRNPYPDDERSRAYAVMNNVFLHLHPVRVRQHAVKFAYTFCLGGPRFFLFLVLTVTGVYLMFFYIPSETQAYSNILRHPEPGGVRAADPEHPPLGRPPDGVLRVPAHDAGLLPRRLQAAPRVQLGRRRRPAVPDDHAQLHRLPAAVGPDRVLGHHDRLEHGRLRAAVQHPVQAAAPGRHRGGPEHAAPLLRAPHHGLPAGRGDLPRRPLLADPQGRRHQRPALNGWGDEMTDTKQPPETRVVQPVDPTRRTEIDKQRVPMSARPYRLLALVKQDAVVRVQKEPDDTVMTWPHLLTIEFMAAALMSVFLLIMGLIINAPLEDLANGNVTPAVAKAPWYFLGLQELLAYFHPTVAGVLVPDVRPRRGRPHPVHRPRRTSSRRGPRTGRPPSCCSRCSATLGLFVTFVGIFFRGPGYSFVIPYLEFFSIGTPGLHFAL